MPAGKIGLRRIQTADQPLQFVQDSVEQALQALQNVPFGGGTFVQIRSAQNGQTTTSLPLVAAQDNVFAHQLGAVPTLVLPLAPDAQATIWCTERTRETITLRTSANCNAAVWVS